MPYVLAIWSRIGARCCAHKFEARNSTPTSKQPIIVERPSFAMEDLLNQLHKCRLDDAQRFVDTRITSRALGFTLLRSLRIVMWRIVSFGAKRELRPRLPGIRIPAALPNPGATPTNVRVCGSATLYKWEKCSPSRG